MKRVYIIFLNDKDLAGFSFRGVLRQIQNYVEDVCQSTNYNEVMNFIKDLSTDEEPLIITFIGHGGKDGLCVEVNENRIELSYLEILNNINSIRTNYPVYLNLVANCNSFKCLEVLEEGHLVDEIWYTNTFTSSANLAVQASNEKNFERFISNFDEEESVRYDVYKKQKS
jgi:hypothetical protein